MNMEGSEVINELYMKKIKNRFELVLLASQRTFGILSGDPMALDIKKYRHKATVLALKEISLNSLDFDKLKQLVISRYLRETVNPEEKKNVLNEEVVNLRDVEGNIFQEEEITPKKADIGIHNILTRDKIIQETETEINPYDSISFDKEEGDTDDEDADEAPKLGSESNKFDLLTSGIHDVDEDEL